MKTLDYCRVMAGIEAAPYDKVHLTVGQLMQLREHVKACAECAGRLERVLKLDNTPPRIGADREAN